MTDPLRAYSQPGLAMFAGVLAAMVGTMNLIYGIFLLVNNQWLILAEEGLFYVDATAWGWALLVFAVVQILVAIGIFSGQAWARLVGIAWAAVVAVGHMFALPAFPLWSLLIIALSVLIIYGLAGGLEEE